MECSLQEGCLVRTPGRNQRGQYSEDEEERPSAYQSKASVTDTRVYCCCEVAQSNEEKGKGDLQDNG